MRGFLSQAATPAVHTGAPVAGDAAGWQAAAGAVAPVAEAGAAAAGTGNGAGSDAALAEERARAKVMNDRFAEACQTCKNRKYQDGSNDPGVSFKTPQNIHPDMAASVVAGHEQEHVMHEQAKAEQEGAEVVSQTVVLHGDICPECGRYYVAGGTTTTVTRHGGHQTADEMQKAQQGGGLNVTA